MRKTLFFLIMLFGIFAYGCEVSQTRYLQLVSPTEDIATQNQPYILKFFVVNPTSNTFTGNIDYQFNSKCLNSYPTSENVEITPQEYKKAISHEFRYNTENSRYGTATNNCLKTPLRITVTLKDKGGDVKDTLNVLLSITG